MVRVGQDYKVDIKVSIKSDYRGDIKKYIKEYKVVRTSSWTLGGTFNIDSGSMKIKGTFLLTYRSLTQNFKDKVN